MNKHVAQIGGVFLYSEDPKTLADWYTGSLGIAFDYTDDFKAYFASLYYLDIETQKKYYTAFSILASKNRPVLDTRPFCLNLRINDLEKLVEELKAKNLQVKDIEVYPEGKFAWLSDPENNWIELWEDTAS